MAVTRFLTIFVEQATGPTACKHRRGPVNVTACHSEVASHEPGWMDLHQHCGACCRLCPERSEALAALNDEQRRQYLSMVGEDGWCIHYDSGGRRCRI